MLKHMLKDALKTFENALLYSKEDVTITNRHNRHSHNKNNLNLKKDIKNSYIMQRLLRFTNVINKKMSIESIELHYSFCATLVF